MPEVCNATEDEVAIVAMENFVELAAMMSYN